MIRVYVKEIEKKPTESRRTAELRAIQMCVEAAGISDIISHFPSGEPYLKQHPELKISVSHSHCFAAFAVGPVAEGLFGVDVEDASRKQLVKVASRFLMPDELELAGLQKNGLAKAWTAKEAVYKASAIKNPDYKHGVCLSHDEFGQAETEDKEVFNLYFAELEHNNILCVACKGNKFEIITL